MKLKKLFSAALLAGGMAAAGSASAVGVFPEFTVNPAVFGGPAATFVADKLTGNYAEVITFGAGNTFTVSLLWEAGQFSQNDGTAAIPGVTTGLSNNYGIYALFTGNGTVAAGAGGTTLLNLGAGNLNVYVDRYAPISTFVAPATGATPYTVVGLGDDGLIATGVATFGQGILQPLGSPGCNAGINCGSFGQTTTFALTPLGSTFFTAPVPFHSVSFQSGQFNLAGLTATQSTNGSLDVVFRTPEPSSIALFGLALLGLAAARRRKSS